MNLFTLVWRNFGRRKLRTLLTVSSLIVAFFLLCALRTLVTTIASGTSAASSSRLVVQSAVSLFVDLPLSYERKIAAVPGVGTLSKWQWFGGYYQEEKNQFGQFAVDPGQTLELYPEMEIVEGSADGFMANRRGCLIGNLLADRFGWKVGDTIPLIPTIFPHPDGPDAAWEFQIEAIYAPTQRSFQGDTFFFHWDYFEKTLEDSIDDLGVGTYILRVQDGTDPVGVMAAIDALFENGPQRVQATSESEFTAQFVSMLGNVPFFVTTIGGGVLAAILLAVVNTMLMSGREQTHDVGILKALGFTDRDAAKLLIAQSLLLCAVGGGIGLALAKLTEPGIARAMGAFFPGYYIQPATLVLGALLALGLGAFAGAVPAWRAGKLRTVDALGSEE